MSSFLMQRLPVLEGLFCPTTLVMTFGSRVASRERCGIFELTEVIDSK
jgi:hypothetical protein